MIRINKKNMESKLKDFVSTFKNKPKLITVAEEFKRLNKEIREQNKLKKLK